MPEYGPSYLKVYFILVLFIISAFGAEMADTLLDQDQVLAKKVLVLSTPSVLRLQSALRNRVLHAPEVREEVCELHARHNRRLRSCFSPVSLAIS